MQFYIVDVFAEKKYAGNQLAVVRGAETLSEEEMLKIARETNFSETAFIMSDDKQAGGYNVRIFTPAEEVPFAGHPSLGTAYIIRTEIIGEQVPDLILNLQYGKVPVFFNRQSGKSEVVWLKAPEPHFTTIFLPQRVSKILGVDDADIDTRYPIQELSTGLPAIIVPLKKLAAVKQCKVDQERYYDLIANTQAKSILVFAPEAYEAMNHLNARCFGDYYGVPEDPATGSANTCLAAYLTKYQYFGSNKIAVRVEQGYEINRPSVLYLDASEQNGDYEIYVGGKVVPVVKGELYGA